MKKQNSNKKRIVGIILSISIFIVANITGFTLAGCQSTGAGGYTANQTGQEKKREREKERERRDFQREVLDDALDSF